jgi:hypothetical protein
VRIETSRGFARLLALAHTLQGKRRGPACAGFLPDDKEKQWHANWCRPTLMNCRMRKKAHEERKEHEQGGGNASQGT